MRHLPFPVTEHPLTRDTFAFPTLQIQEMMTQISRWLDIHLPGGFIYSESRVGKTWGIKYIFRHQKELWAEPMPMFKTLMVRDEPATQLQFYDKILDCIGQAFTTGDKPRKLKRIIDSLQHAAQQEQAYRVLLMIDEAQYITNSQFRWLMDIFNRLEDRDIKLTTILVGNPTLKNKCDELYCEDVRTIVGRFMTDYFNFRGMRSASELAAFLRSFDAGESYPPGSDWTFTRYFMPVAYENGWRLEDQSELIWRMFGSYSMENYGCEIHELAMQPIVFTLNSLLRQMMDLDQAHFILQEQLVKDMIHYAVGYQMKFFLDQPSE